MKKVKQLEPLALQTLITAATVYLNRQSRASHPDGEFDKAKRWYPDASEKCDCCDAIRSPSRDYPFSLMVHCRSVGHVANLYGVNATDLKRMANEMLKIEEEQAAQSKAA